DKVLLLADTNCVPTGDGSNCIAVATPTPTATPPPGTTPTPMPTVVVTPAPGATPAPNGGGTPVSGTITLPSTRQADTSVTYLLDGKPVPSGKLDTTQLANGTHTLEVVKKNADGTTQITAQKLFVSNIKHWWTGVLDWVMNPANAVMIAGAAVLLALAGGLVWWFKFRIPRPILNIPKSPAPGAPGIVMPPDGVVYPDPPTDRGPEL